LSFEIGQLKLVISEMANDKWQICNDKSFSSTMSNAIANSFDSPWPHRLAVVLACATFPLVWVGGLVTTTDAGMAVPDWPNTYGYNLFLYPWQTWLSAPWDLFVEHGHRLLAATVGLITIGLVIVLFRVEHRRWLRGLGIAALALVIFQGVLGGMRVLMDERTLAMLHGMTGPLFFAVAVALVVFTSHTWLRAANSGSQEIEQGGGHIRVLATATALLVYLQIVLGAVLRHVPVDSQAGTFMLAVHFHLFLAGVLVLHIAALVSFVLSHVRSMWPLGVLALALAVLLALQIGLGVATWIVKYSVPSWASGLISTPSVAIRDGGWLQTHTITAHVAVGSLLLATSVATALYSFRLLRQPNAIRQLGGARLEAAL
jgi:cytochrome c oxidase assembly protein subunit 15